MIALLLVLGAMLWVALLMAASLVPDPLAAALYGIGSLICHQIPERSFALGAYQLPVCGRCLGLYAGAAAGGLAALLPGTGIASRRPLPARGARWMVGAAAVPTALTLVLEWSGLWAGSNAGRFAAGLLLGGAAAVVVVRAVAASAGADVRVVRHGLVD